MSEREQQSKTAVRRADSVSEKPPRQISLSMALSIMLLVGATSFILGSRSEEMAFLWSNNQNGGLPADLNYRELDVVYDKLRLDFDGKLDAEKLLEGAKKGLVEASGDPYSEYFTNSEAEQFFSDLDGEFSGIGAELGKKDDLLTIISTIDGSPAQKAGLRPGDVIGMVNGQDALQWPIDRAVDTIRGEKGTTVKLTIRRGDEVKTFSVVRDDIVNPSVHAKVLEGNIGYIRMSRFDELGPDLTRKAAQEFKNKGVKKVILDLRGNGGGYVGAAQAIASIWLEPGTLIVEQRQGGKTKDSLKAEGEPLLRGVPTVVLIDGYSASASEIVAGALRDQGAATLVGEKTFGKGSVQEIEEVPGGGSLKVTVAKWYTPKGKNIDHEGIKPDHVIGLTEQDFNKGNDPQRDKAAEVLNK